MNYLDIETIQLFLYLIHYKPEKSYREFHNLLDCTDSPEKLKTFSEKVKDDIFDNKLEDNFIFKKYHPKTEHIFYIALKDYHAHELRKFLEEYSNKFRYDELKGNPNIFPFKIQLQYFQKEFEYLSEHYGDRFFVTPVFREENNSKETIACGLRIFDFLIFLYFRSDIIVRSCKRILPSDNYLYLKDKFFNIALEIELFKPVKQIFKEINDEIKAEETLRKSKNIIIAGYTIEKIKKGWDKGKFRITCEKSIHEGLILSKARVNVLVYLLERLYTEVSANEVLKEFNFKGKVPIATLETYIRELNTTLRGIHRPKGRKQYLEIKNDIIINRIP